MAKVMSDEAPVGVPMLARGKHRGPADGSCLMEYVAVLAGRTFSDRPGCTHPLLGWLARNVNDAVSDAARPQLAGLAPALIGTRVRHRGAYGVVRATVYGELAAAGLAVAPHDRWLRELAEIATAHLDRHSLEDAPPCSASGSGSASTTAVMGARRQPLFTFDRNFTFGAVSRALSQVEPERRDQLLCAALSAAVMRARRGLGLREVAVSLQAREPAGALWG